MASTGGSGSDERDGVSLCRMAFHSGRYPSACYRLVKELTGLTWAELRARGLRWFQSEFARQLQSAMHKL